MTVGPVPSDFNPPALVVVVGTRFVVVNFTVVLFVVVGGAVLMVVVGLGVVSSETCVRQSIVFPFVAQLNKHRTY